MRVYLFVTLLLLLTGCGQSTTSATVIPLTPPAERYWLNTASDVRHNARCKHFNATKKGRFCTATEGTPCRHCGG